MRSLLRLNAVVVHFSSKLPPIVRRFIIAGGFVFSALLAGAYLKSKLTDTNLRRYFEANAIAYNGTRYRVSQIFIRPVSTSQADITSAIKDLSGLAADIQTQENREIAFASRSTGTQSIAYCRVRRRTRLGGE